MLKKIKPLRKIINIPAACRERYIPLEHPVARRWVEVGTQLSGVSDLVEGYCIGIPEQRSLMLIATTAGAGFARTEHSQFELQPNTLLINIPGDGIEFAPTGATWSLVWWYFKPSAQWPNLLSGPTRVQSLPEAGLLSAMMDGLITRLTRAHQVVDAADLALSGAILAQLVGISPQQQPNDDALVRLWSIVEQRLHEPWPLGELALRARVSVPTFQRMMHRRYQLSAHQMLLSLRMRRAEELLRRTDYPLRVIAEQVGYADAFTFSSAFHRRHGRTPSSVRVS